MRTNELMAEGVKKLCAAGIPNASLECRLFLQTILNVTAVKLYTTSIEVTPEQEREFWSMTEKRGAHMPSQYITGRSEFMGLSFSVNPGALIPRPDTEIAVETALKFIDERKYKTALDIGVGSGAIAVSLAAFSKAATTAADISEAALETAKQNALQNGVNVNFIQSDLFENVSGSFDLIISNPPYIPTDEIESLMPEVRLFEPRNALDGGKDGLDFYRKITSQARDYINDGGALIFEVGHNQAEQTKQLMLENGFIDVGFAKDLAGIDRVVYGIKK